MNGVLIVAVIASLIFCVGLGFAVLTLHSKLEDITEVIDRLMDIRSEDQISTRKENVEKWEAIKNNAESIQLLGNSYLEMKNEYAGVKRDVYGTADLAEFARLKTAVYKTLPDRIKRLEDFINGKPEMIRIEDADKLEELHKALRVSAFDIKEDSDERAD